MKGTQPRSVGGTEVDVWMRTLAASIGDSMMSAKNSADADEMRYSDVRYWNANSCTHQIVILMDGGSSD